MTTGLPSDHCSGSCAPWIILVANEGSCSRNPWTVWVVVINLHIKETTAWFKKNKQSRCCWFEQFKTPAVLSKQTWHSQSKVDGIFGLTALGAVLVQSNTFWKLMQKFCWPANEWSQYSKSVKWSCALEVVSSQVRAFTLSYLDDSDIFCPFNYKLSRWHSISQQGNGTKPDSFALNYPKLDEQMPLGISFLSRSHKTLYVRRQMRVPLGEGQPRACPYFLVSLVGLFSCFVWLWLETFNRYGWYRDVSRIRCQYERKNSPFPSLSPHLFFCTTENCLLGCA